MGTLYEKCVPPPGAGLNLDPRYQNEDFRRQQAERYLGFYQEGVQLSREEHILIPSLCSYEIKALQAWNNLTIAERVMFKISSPFFSRLPKDTKSAMQISGTAVLGTVAILYGAATHNDKLVGISGLLFALFLSGKMYFRNR
jgi:hypothetical protein